MSVLPLFHRRCAPVVLWRALERRDWLLALGVSALYLGWFLLVQPLVAVNGGQGWDGADYFRLAQGDYQTPVYPLVQRIGLPWLAGRWPTGDILLNFRLINAVVAWLHGVATWIMLAAITRRDQRVLQGLAWVLICAIQVGPIPLSVWSPVQNDAISALLSQCLLVGLLAGVCHGWMLLLLFFVATLCRENFAQFFIFFLLRCDLYWDRAHGLLANARRLLADNWREMTLLLLPSVLGYVSATWLVSQVVSKGVTIAQRFSTYLDYVSWHHLTDYSLSLIGVLSAAWLFRFAAGVAGLQPSFARPLPFAATRIIVCVLLVIGLGGGTNTERYLYWVLPFLVVQSLGMMDALLRNRLYVLLGFCVLYALYMQRSVTPIDIIGMSGCSPVDIFTGRSAFMGHFGQQCETDGRSTLLFFFFVVMPVVTVLALWRPSSTFYGIRGRDEN